MIKYLPGILILLILGGCVKKTNWPLQDSLPKTVIVDGIITDHYGTQEIRLRYPVAHLNEIAQPVAGANVIVNSDDSSFVFSEDALNPGNYLSVNNFAAMAGQNYTLLVFVGSAYYSAKTTMVAGAGFDPLTYSKNADDNLYHINFIAGAFDPNNPAMWEVILDWSNVPGYNKADSLKNRAKFNFYTLSTIDVTEIFAPETEKISFPAGTVVVQNRYSLTPGHAAFLREMLSETTWQGSLFCTLPSNVSTNLSSGAAGYFGVCAVTTLSFTVNQ